MPRQFTQRYSISIELLKKIIRYEESGNLFWISRNPEDFPQYTNANITIWNKKYSDKPCGFIIDVKGYKSKYLKILGTSYRYSSVVWALNFDFWPENCIDHIDGNALNNRIDNLRIVTYAENNRNASLRKDNKSGFSGIYFSKKLQKWVVCIGGEYLGVFSDKEIAIEVRKKALVDKGFHPNHTRR